MKASTIVDLGIKQNNLYTILVSVSIHSLVVLDSQYVSFN